MRYLVFVAVVWGVFFLLYLQICLILKRVFMVLVPYEYLLIAAVLSIYFFASAAARRFQGIISDSFYYVAASRVGTIWLLFCATFLYTVVYVVVKTDAPQLLSACSRGRDVRALRPMECPAVKGTGTWGPPMRLGSRNQAAVLRLVPVLLCFGMVETSLVLDMFLSGLRTSSV